MKIDAERLEGIEFKCAHLEKAVQELSDALYAQQQQLERLQTHLQALIQHVEQLSAQANPSASSDSEVPPHY